MRKINILLLVALLDHFSCSSQTVKKFNYEINGNLNGEKEKPFLGMEQEFSTLRTYSNLNEFKETRIFTGSDKDAIQYKIEKNIWYYKINDKWQLFCDLKKNKGGIIKLSGITHKVTIGNTVQINGITLYKVQLKPLNTFQSHNPSYYFDLSNGVVIIKNSNGTILLRQDFFIKKLSEDQLQLL